MRPVVVDNSASLNSRMKFSVLFTVLRASTSFVAASVVARSMGPDKMGEYSFLIAFFLALKPLLDLGSGAAFFTLISKDSVPIYQVKRYFLYLAFLLFSVFILVVPVSSQSEGLSKFDSSLVLWAWVGIFCQHILWNASCQIGEALRQNILVQKLGWIISSVHLSLVFLIGYFSALSPLILFQLTVFEYGSMALICVFVLRKQMIPAMAPPVSETLRYYWRYCLPLGLYCFMSFFNQILDNWLLFFDRGPKEQAFSALNNQLASVGVVITASLLGVFWKEMAVFGKNSKTDDLEKLFLRGSRISILISGFIAGGIMISYQEITQVVLGSSYLPGAPLLFILSLFPIHQSQGQLVATLYYSTEQTRLYSKIGVVSLLLSTMLSYIVLSPAFMGSGSIGLALKSVIFQVLAVNFMIWRIGKEMNWKFNWIYQLQIIAIFLVCGVLTKLVVGWTLEDSSSLTRLTLNSVSYAVFAALLLNRLKFFA